MSDTISDTLIIKVIDASGTFMQTAEKAKEIASGPISAPILAWVPLKGFKRILAHFASVHDAALARQSVNYKMPAAAKAYFSAYDFLSEHTQSFLEAPENDKQFFISPPASPPVDWSPEREPAPNTEHVFHDDLQNVLESIKNETVQHNPTGKLTRKRTLHEPLKISTSQAESLDTSSLPTPTITLEWDDETSLRS